MDTVPRAILVYINTTTCTNILHHMSVANRCHYHGAVENRPTISCRDWDHVGNFFAKIMTIQREGSGQKFMVKDNATP